MSAWEPFLIPACTAAGVVIGGALGCGTGYAVKKYTATAGAAEHVADGAVEPVADGAPESDRPESDRPEHDRPEYERPPRPWLPDVDPTRLPPASVASIPDIAAPKAKPAKHEVFEVPTHYLSEANEFFIPLDRFHMYIMFQEERPLFAQLVEAIDNIVGLDEMLTARTPVARSAIPVIAQTARNRASKLMRVIIDFNHERRPSKIKKEKMETLRTDIVKILDEIIVGMHTTLAQRPIGQRISE